MMLILMVKFIEPELGELRKRLIKPLVGDEVEFDVTNGTEGYILKIMPRKTL